MERPLHLLTVSAKSEEALLELAQRYQVFLNDTDSSLADICYTAHTGRRHFGHRLAVVAASTQEMKAQLTAYCAGEISSGIAQNYVSNMHQAAKIAFLFPGQGCQYLQMGRELYETQPIFRAALDRCNQILQPLLDKSLLSIIYPDPETDELRADIDQTAYTQPALFAVSYALVQLWRSWGIEPDVVMGHSAGEYVAACVAGVFSLEDGLKLIAARGRLMQALPQNGEMVSILASSEEVETLLDAQKVAIAAINGPRSVVISGESAAVQTVVSELSSRDIKCQTLAVSHAFHSPLMEPMLASFAQVAKEIDYRPPQIAYVSNLSGELAANQVTSPDYWVRHVREAVRFADGIVTLFENQVDIFIEMSPKPILLGMGQLCLPESEATWLPSLRPHSEWSQLLTSLGELYVHGVNIDWQGFDQAYHQARRKASLPTYAFQRQRYWLEPVLDSAKLSRVRPLLDKMIQSPLHKATLFETEFSIQTFPFAGDYRLHDVAVLPGAVHLAMLLSAVEVHFGVSNCLLEDVRFPTPFVIPDAGARRVQVILSSTTEPQMAEIQVISFAENELDTENVLTHATGRVFIKPQSITKNLPFDDLLKRCTTEVDTSAFYQTVAAQQISLGPTFQWMEEIWCGEGEALVKLQRPQEIRTLEGHVLHPGLLNACLQTIGVLASEEGQDTFSLPSVIAAVHLYTQVQGRMWWCYVKQGEKGQWEIALLDENGRVLAELAGVETQTITREVLHLMPEWAEWLYTVDWQPRPHFGLPTTYLPTLQQFSEVLTTQFHRRTANIDWSRLLQGENELEAISLAYVLSALDALGFDWQPGLRLRTEQLMTQLSVIHRYGRLLDRLLGMLAEEGLVQREGAYWVVIHKAQIPSIPQITTEDTPAPQRLLARCAQKLAEVLRGVQDPLKLLFPGGDASLVAEVYQDSPTAPVMSQLIQEAMQNAFKELPAAQGLRILEVGAGTGSTTELILPHLPVERTEYLFTDIERALLVQAEEAFAAYDFIQYGLLDIEQAPIEQGFSPHQYDMVIASDVLHTTQDLSQTLAHIQQLLKPDGLLLLLEMTNRHRWVDLTFGLAEEWWRFTDTAIRPDHPLLSAEQWQEQLLTSGFKAVTHVPEASTQHSHTLMLAQAGAAKQEGQWLLFTDVGGVGESVAESLRTQGGQPILVWPGSEYKQLDENVFQINPLLIADYQRLLEMIPAPSRVVHLWSLDAPLIEASTDLESTLQSSCGTALLLTQAILQSQPPSPDLWLVTQGAQLVMEGDLVSGFAQATLWGMGRTIALEHPDLHCVCLDLDAQMSPQAQGKALYTEVMAASPANHEPQVALRQKSRLVARLVRAPEQTKAHSKSANRPISADGTYLITAGLGELGLLTAERLIQQGACHLMLVEQNQPNPEVQPKLEALRTLGAEITIVQADVAECEQIAHALAQIHTAHP
ncbi:MAG: acyltransferase domain-containing protein, partial [Caldilineaceae bacterium]|nr:acyltransferase domain-containing protein [Caldilineaceae bacterium]